MKLLPTTLLSRITVFAFVMITLISCSDSDDDFANIFMDENTPAEFNGGFVGNGGSGTATFTWMNNKATANYNASAIATQNGTFRMQVNDANGNNVLNRTLIGGTGTTSITGESGEGEPGTWTITITLTTFNGNGIFSLTEGS